MRTKFLVCLSALPIVAFGIISCSNATMQSREGPAPGVQVDSTFAPNARIKLNTVAIIDKSLQHWEGSEGGRYAKIAVENTDSRRTETGTLEVWAVLRNRTDFPLQIEGKTTFFDHSQVPLEDVSSWQRVFLPPQGVATYREFSKLTSAVAYYYIEIKEGR